MREEGQELNGVSARSANGGYISGGVVLVNGDLAGRQDDRTQAPIVIIDVARRAALLGLKGYRVGWAASGRG